jgi:hypothetical protein
MAHSTTDTSNLWRLPPLLSSSDTVMYPPYTEAMYRMVAAGSIVVAVDGSF